MDKKTYKTALISKPQPSVAAPTKQVKSTVTTNQQQMNTSNANQQQQHRILTSQELNQQPSVNNGQYTQTQLNKYNIDPAELRDYLDLIAMHGVIPRTAAQLTLVDKADILKLMADFQHQYSTETFYNGFLRELPFYMGQREEFYMGLSLETLFYKFYIYKEDHNIEDNYKDKDKFQMMVKMMAIRALRSRNWMFHKKNFCWFKRFV